jgi:YegS/Rv2252/BmrU family lipid kinase
LSSPTQAVLIVNTHSRRGREWFPRVQKTLEDSPIEIVGAHALEDPSHIARRVQEAVARGVPLIIVGGGDGSLSAAATQLLGSESTLGVLPLGTGNQFARDLEIATDVRKACDVLVNGERRLVDVGTIGDEIFLNVVTVGLSTLIARSLTPASKRRLGRMVYLFALAKALRNSAPFEVTITLEEETITMETVQVVIGNGRFHAGPFPLAPDARITDGKLVLYALKSMGKLALLRYAARLPGGTHGELEDVEAHWTVGGKLDAVPTQRVTIDGEVSAKTPLVFGVRQGALPVMAPRGFEPAEGQEGGQPQP